MIFISQMTIPRFGHLPCGESLSSHGSLLNHQLAALFNPDAYRRLRPELQHFSDSDLYQHWFNAPNSGELAAAMNQKSNDLISKAQLRALPDDDPIMMFLNDLFPYDYYRSLRSDLQHLENRELLFHYWDFGRFEGVSLSEQGLQIICKHLSMPSSRLFRRELKSLKVYWLQCVPIKRMLFFS